MTTAVSIEPTANGFRAKTSGPTELAAEAESASKAMADLASQLETNAREQTVEKVMTPKRAERIIEAARQLQALPGAVDFISAIHEYRRSSNAVETDE